MTTAALRTIYLKVVDRVEALEADYNEIDHIEASDSLFRFVAKAFPESLRAFRRNCGFSDNRVRIWMRTAGGKFVSTEMWSETEPETPTAKPRPLWWWQRMAAAAASSAKRGR